MKINLEYLTPTTIKALYDTAQDAWNDSDSLNEGVELTSIMEQLDEAYIGLTGEKLADFEKFF